SFDSALRNARLLLTAEALSVETIDSKVLNLARQDISWHTVKALINDDITKPMQGINIVEFAGEQELVNNKVAALISDLDKLINQQQQGIIGYQLCQQATDIDKIYAMRKKAVGLLGNSQ